MALVRPITDDADIRDTLDHAIDAVLRLRRCAVLSAALMLASASIDAAATAWPRNELGARALPAGSAVQRAGRLPGRGADSAEPGRPATPTWTAPRAWARWAAAPEPVLAFLQEWPQVARVARRRRLCPSMDALVHARCRSRPTAGHRAAAAEPGRRRAPAARARPLRALPARGARPDGSAPRCPSTATTPPSPARACRCFLEQAPQLLDLLPRRRPVPLGRLRRAPLPAPPASASASTSALQSRRQPRRAAARAPWHAAGRRRAPARADAARPVAGRRCRWCPTAPASTTQRACPCPIYDATTASACPMSTTHCTGQSAGTRPLPRGPGPHGRRTGAGASRRWPTT